MWYPLLLNGCVLKIKLKFHDTIRYAYEELYTEWNMVWIDILF